MTMNPVTAPQFLPAPLRVPRGTLPRKLTLRPRLHAWLQSLTAEILSWTAGCERPL
jgi:predicted DNA-binding transcriptional regulator AlpA